MQVIPSKASAKRIAATIWSAVAASMAATILLLAASPAAMAQESTYRFDLGGGIGMSGYLGDANTSSLYKNPGFGTQINFRYLPNTRWAIRGTLGVASLSGDSKYMTNVYPAWGTYKFNSTVFDLSCRAEFNFFNYGIGEKYRKMSRWSPYLGLGLGASLANCGGTHVAFNIPMYVGVRYKLRPRVNVGVEWTMTKTFSDNIDGTMLDDLYQIKSSFAKNTDWYSTLMLTISFEFGERCKSCYYQD